MTPTKELTDVLGTGALFTGLNADKLDGINSTGFMRVVKSDVADLNQLTVAGCYQIRAVRDNIANRPDKGTSYPNVLVLKGEGTTSDTLTQIYCDYDDCLMFARSGNTVVNSGNNIANRTWNQLAFVTSNVASAQKLQDSQGVFLDRATWNALVARVSALDGK